MAEENKDFNVEDLLKEIFKPATPIYKESLKDLFDRRLHELKISQTSVLEIIGIQSRTLSGILNGTQKSMDFTNLIKISNFLQLPKEQVLSLYIEALEKKFPEQVAYPSDKIEFIRDNFDLATLKKAGFISSINDYEEIEKKLISFLGLKEIFDYVKPAVDVAFSAGLVKPKNDLTRSFWIKAASNIFKEIDNPNLYNRQALIEYFPQIRWHSTSVELGLTNVIRDLFKMGVTVIYQSSLPSIHLRGATFSVNGKPCIVITNYKGYYPTLWFALIHELFHVLFDWEEIRDNNYHLSDEDTDQLSVIEKEKEADNFAREYLFSKDKTTKVRPYLNDFEYVKEFAITNHVHPSFVYVFNAYDVGKKDRTAWAKATRQNPNIEDLTKQLDNPWNSPKPIVEFVKSIKYKIYS